MRPLRPFFKGIGSPPGIITRRTRHKRDGLAKRYLRAGGAPEDVMKIFQQIPLNERRLKPVQAPPGDYHLPVEYLEMKKCRMTLSRTGKHNRLIGNSDETYTNSTMLTSADGG